MQNATNRDFPEENTIFTTRKCRSTPTRNLKIRASRGNLASAYAHTSRFNQRVYLARKQPFRISRSEMHPSCDKPLPHETSRFLGRVHRSQQLGAGGFIECTDYESPHDDRYGDDDGQGDQAVAPEAGAQFAECAADGGGVSALND